LLAGRYIIPIAYPVVPGHEWAGEIVDVGRNVRGFSKGERVTGECVVRTPERVHHFGFSLNGADQEYFTVNPQWLHKLPDSLDDKQASLIEPFSCGYHAIMSLGGTNASETVVVSGGGTIGLCSAMAAIGMGARVIVVDPIASRRDVAVRLGAHAALDPADGNAVERIQELTDGKGGDLVVEAAGHDRSLSAVLDYVREEGRIAMVGISIGRMVPSVLGQIQMKNLTLRGSIGSPGVWPAAIRFLERTGMNLSPIQTHEYALDDAVDAFAFGKDHPTESIKITLLNS